jgi:hypothetical protein
MFSPDSDLDSTLWPYGDFEAPTEVSLHDVPPSDESGPESRSYSFTPSQSSNWNNNTDSSGRRLLVVPYEKFILALKGHGIDFGVYEKKVYLHTFTLNERQTYGRSILTWDDANEVEVYIDLVRNAGIMRQRVKGSVTSYFVKRDNSAITQIDKPHVADYKIGSFDKKMTVHTAWTCSEDHGSESKCYRFVLSLKYAARQVEGGIE